MKYTIEKGTDIESTSYLLSDDAEFKYLLDKLKDNNNNGIKAIDIRNVILSLYSNSVFNQTSVNKKDYIGIDSNNPDDKDIKNKILLGNKLVNGENVFTDDMYNNDSDVFIYNTKKDFISNIKTDVVFLSGTNKSLFNDAPKISTQYLSNKNVLNFNILNKNSNINIKSDFDININNQSVDTVNNLNTLSSNNKVLMYDNNKITLSNPESVSSISDIGFETQELNFTGDLTLNNYPLEFSDNRMIPKEIGSIKQGENFDKIAISELLKRMLYTELDPSVSIKLLPPYSNGFIEVGIIPDEILIEYKITKTTSNTQNTILTNMDPNFYPPITDEGFKTITGTASGLLSPIPTELGYQDYTISVTDIKNKKAEQNISLNIVYPIFYGLGEITNNITYYNNFLDKLVVGKNDVTVQIVGKGKIYFMYPSYYGNLSKIVDDFDNEIIFSYFLYNQYTSPDGNWVEDYFIYESDLTYDISLSDPMFLTFKFYIIIYM